MTLLENDCDVLSLLYKCALKTRAPSGITLGVHSRIFYSCSVWAQHMQSYIRISFPYKVSLSRLWRELRILLTELFLKKIPHALQTNTFHFLVYIVHPRTYLKWSSLSYKLKHRLPTWKVLKEEWKKS